MVPKEEHCCPNQTVPQAPGYLIQAVILQTKVSTYRKPCLLTKPKFGQDRSSNPGSCSSAHIITHEIWQCGAIIPIIPHIGSLGIQLSYDLTQWASSVPHDSSYALLAKKTVVLTSTACRCQRSFDGTYQEGDGSHDELCKKRIWRKTSALGGAQSLIDLYDDPGYT